jgi:hypothetical protein
MKVLKKSIGTMVLAGLLLAAIGAPNAGAVTLHECKEAAGTGTAYSDSGCSVKSEAGKFQLVPVPAGTALTFTNGGTSTLTMTIAGVKFKISCTGGSGSGSATNEEEGGTMKVRGTGGVAKFEGCSVTEPAGKGCTVPSTISTETLKSETVEMKDVITPALGETFTTITVSGCSTSALNGSKSITGKASGINTNGMTTEFTASSGSELKFGGQNATLIGTTDSKITATGRQALLLTP